MVKLIGMNETHRNCAKSNADASEYIGTAKVVLRKTRPIRSAPNASWHKIGDRKFYFRSKWEYHYALYLQFLKGLMRIIDWDYEPQTFWFEGIKRGCVSYTPDFLILQNEGNYWV